MNVRTFRIRPDRPLEPIESGDGSLGALDGPTWHDVTGTDEEWADACADDLDLSPFSTELVSGHRRIAFGLVTRNTVSFRVPMVGDDGVSVDHLVGVCFEDRLVTFHNAPAATLDRYVPGGRTVDSVSDLVVALFAHFSFELVDIGHGVKDRIDELTERVHQSGGQLHAASLRDLDTRFHCIDSAVDDHRHVLNILTGATNDAVDLTDTVPPLAIAVGNIQALADDVDTYDRRLERLQDRYSAQLQERVNHRINILTMISAIFLPLSLLAGIYGMNFEHMPGTGLRWGFWILMAVMLAIALGLSWFFWRRQWR